jgi:hypothetical protein
LDFIIHPHYRKNKSEIETGKGYTYFNSNRIINEEYALNMPVNNFIFILETTNSTRWGEVNVFPNVHIH